MGSGTTWGTSSEISFIDGLGTHASSKSPTDEGRLLLLKGYREGISRRVVWEWLDRFLILSHVNNRIREIEGRLEQ